MTAVEEVRCRAHGCERELTDQLSRARGYGPVCWANRHPAQPARHQLAAGRPTGPRPAGGGQDGPDLLDQLADRDDPAGPP